MSKKNIRFILNMALVGTLREIIRAVLYLDEPDDILSLDKAFESDLNNRISLILKLVLNNVIGEEEVLKQILGDQYYKHIDYIDLCYSIIEDYGNNKTLGYLKTLNVIDTQVLDENELIIFVKE